MRRAFAWLAGLVGIAALGRAWARRRARPTAPAASAPAPAADSAADPAQELKARLDEQREREALEPAEPETIDERRARIHAKAQQAIDEMREPSA